MNIGFMTGRQARIHFPLLLAVSLAVWWHSLVRTFRLALGHEEYTHILLVLPVTFVILYIGAKELAAGLPGNPRAGAVLLLVALLLRVVTGWRGDVLPNDAQLSVSMLALVMWWIGSLVYCFGIPLLRNSVLSLCLLFLFIPLPQSAVSGVRSFLQDWSASSARVMFRAMGTPVTQDGLLISIPGIDLEVAEQCSSIRSSMMLILVTIVLAQLLLRSWWSKTLLVLTAVPLSFLKNGLRIAVLGEIGTRFDPEIFEGWLHHQGGVVFLSVAIGATAIVLWILRRAERVVIGDLKENGIQSPRISA